MKRPRSTANNQTTSSATKTRKTHHNTTVMETPKVRSISSRCNSIGGVYHAKTTDVNFVFDVDGNEEMVPVHKCILAIHSPVFRRILYESELKESGHIKLTDTTVDAFLDFIEFLYGAKLYTIKSYTKSEISALVYLAHKYDVNWLEEEFKSVLSLFIDKHVQAVLWFASLSKLYSYNDLQLKCFEKFRSHGNVIMGSAEFVHCEKDVLKGILSFDFVDRNEVKVFEMCIKWAKSACKKVELDPESPGIVRTQLGDCFDLIRFGSMTQEQFLQCLTIYPEVFTYDEIQKFSCKFSGSKFDRDALESQCHVKTMYPFHVAKLVETGDSFLKSLVHDKTTADVDIIFKNARNETTGWIPAHKCILAYNSETFANLFKNSTEPYEEIHIADTSTEDFQAFLQLIYTFDWIQRIPVMRNISDHSVNTILLLASEYRANWIIWCYESYLKHYLNEQNVMWCYDLSLKHSMNDLKLQCEEFLKNNSRESIASESFLDVGQKTLKAVLELHMWENGKSLVDACIKWARKYCGNNQLNPENPKDLRTAFGEAFELIPFSNMDLVEYIRFQRDYDAMFTADEMRQVINSMLI